MGKKSSFTNGTVRLNGQTKASTYKKGKTVYTDYYMSPDEQAAFDFAQKSFAENLPNINVFSEDTRNDFKNQLNAYTKKGIDTINSVYSPMLKNMKNDIASRFGNFDNSSFLNDLKEIESSRSDAISSLAENLVLKENDLVNDELARRYDYLSFLNGVSNQALSNLSSFASLANANSSMGNSGSSSSSSGMFGSLLGKGLDALMSKYF